MILGQRYTRVYPRYSTVLVHSAVHAQPSYGYVASYSFTRSSNYTLSLAEMAEEFSCGALHVFRFKSYIMLMWTSGHLC